MVLCIATTGGARRLGHPRHQARPDRPAGCQGDAKLPKAHHQSPYYPVMICCRSSWCPALLCLFLPQMYSPPLPAILDRSADGDCPLFQVSARYLYTLEHPDEWEPELGILAKDIKLHSSFWAAEEVRLQPLQSMPQPRTSESEGGTSSSSEAVLRSLCICICSFWPLRSCSCTP